MKRAFPVLLVLSSLLSSGDIQAAVVGFPPVTEEERAVTSVPGEPNAPAVVLFKKGEFLMMGHGLLAGSLASHLQVQARVKVLTEAGKSKGEIVIPHSDSTKLASFRGRTILPDGRILPVPADARFIRKTSSSRHQGRRGPAARGPVPREHAAGRDRSHAGRRGPALRDRYVAPDRPSRLGEDRLAGG